MTLIVQGTSLVVEGWLTGTSTAASGPHNFPEEQKVIPSLQIFLLGCREVNNFCSVNCGVNPCIKVL